jgi:hypothetical protein
MISLVMGNQLASSENLLPDYRLPGLEVDGCVPLTFANDSTNTRSTHFNFNATTETLLLSNGSNSEYLVHERTLVDALVSMGFLLDVFSISVMWYPALGCSLCIIFGLFFSLLLTQCEPYRAINPNLLSPPIVWLIMTLFPAHGLKWIDIEDDQPGTSSAASSATATLSVS